MRVTNDTPHPDLPPLKGRRSKFLSTVSGERLGEGEMITFFNLYQYASFY